MRGGMADEEGFMVDFGGTSDTSLEPDEPPEVGGSRGVVPPALPPSPSPSELEKAYQRGRQVALAEDKTLHRCLLRREDCGRAGIIAVGCSITHVEPGSAADEAGLKVDDTIHAVNGRFVENYNDLSEAIKGSGPIVDITFTRKNADSAPTVPSRPPTDPPKSTSEGIPTLQLGTQIPPKRIGVGWGALRLSVVRCVGMG
eukprot:Sspe_Gene.2636::Locus_881_Transcript_3_4_Confidence_0.400_Length_1436::g.2636::m.2636